MIATRLDEDQNRRDEIATLIGLSKLKKRSCNGPTLAVTS
jgi:hypothetical protein